MNSQLLPSCRERVCCSWLGAFLRFSSQAGRLFAHWKPGTELNHPERWEPGRLFSWVLSWISLGATVFKLEKCCGNMLVDSQQGIRGNIYLSEANAFHESGWWHEAERASATQSSSSEVAALHRSLFRIPAQHKVQSRLIVFSFFF